MNDKRKEELLEQIDASIEQLKSTRALLLKDNNIKDAKQMLADGEQGVYLMNDQFVVVNCDENPIYYLYSSGFIAWDEGPAKVPVVRNYILQAENVIKLDLRAVYSKLMELVDE